MSGVPYTFANATTTIALSNLDANFNTPVTIGNTTVGLGNTVTTLGNVTLSNPTISGGTLATLGNTAITGGGTITSIGNVTLANPILTGISNNITFASGTNGIVFNNSGATTNSTLNDYETGLWTPVLSFSGNTTTLTNGGWYVKIGRLVCISFNNQTIGFNVSVGTSELSVSNFPFLAASNATYFYYGPAQFTINPVSQSYYDYSYAGRGAPNGQCNFHIVNQAINTGDPVNFQFTYYASF